MTEIGFDFDKLPTFLTLENRLQACLSAFQSKALARPNSLSSKVLFTLEAVSDHPWECGFRN